MVTHHPTSLPTSVSIRSSKGDGAPSEAARLCPIPDGLYHRVPQQFHQKFILSAHGTTYSHARNVSNNLAANLGITLTRPPGAEEPEHNRALYTHNPAVCEFDALVPMARRSGLTAVARAYDAGMSAPVLVDALVPLARRSGLAAVAQVADARGCWL